MNVIGVKSAFWTRVEVLYVIIISFVRDLIFFVNTFLCPGATSVLREKHAAL